MLLLLAHPEEARTDRWPYLTAAATPPGPAPPPSRWEKEKGCPPLASSPPLFPSTNTAPGSPTIHLPLPYREPASSPTGSLACHTVRLMAVTQVTDSSFTLDLDRYSAALADVAKAETAAGQAMASASGRAQYHPVPGVGIMHWARKTTDPALTVSAG